MWGETRAGKGSTSLGRFWWLPQLTSLRRSYDTLGHLFREIYRTHTHTYIHIYDTHDTRDCQIDPLSFFSMISYHPLHQGGFERSKLCHQVCVFMPRAGSDMILSLEMLNFLFSRWTKSDLSIRMGQFLACINQPNMRIESSHKIHWEGSRP